MKYSNSHTTIQFARRTLLSPWLIGVAFALTAFWMVFQGIGVQASNQLVDGAVVAGVLLLVVAARRKQSYGIGRASATQGLVSNLFQRTGRKHSAHQFTEEQLALLQEELSAMPEDDIPPALLTRYQR